MSSWVCSSGLGRREFAAGLIMLSAMRRAWAQHRPLPVVAFVTPGRGMAAQRYLDAVRRGLLEMGYVDGRNVALEHHHFDRKFELLPELVAELTRRQVAVVCTITNVIALAFNSARSDVQLVFAFGLDPVAMGLVTAFNRPGGNATGVFVPLSTLDTKRLQLLRELLPGLRSVGVLVNPANPNANVIELEAATLNSGLELLVGKPQIAAEIETSFASLVQQGATAIIISSDPIFELQRDVILELAARGRIPVIYPWRDYAHAGGLLSYGNDLTDAARLVGVYAGRILNGYKPGELPVEQPTKFELVINLKTANALGLTIPPTLLARADEVIE